MDCGGCTLCCYTLPVPGRSKKAWSDCRDCESGVGCSNYDDRPPECVSYKCMYLADKLCSDELRPDRIGVLFEKIGEDLILGTMLRDGLHETVPVMAQAKMFRSSGSSVVLHSGINAPRHVLPAKGATTPGVIMRMMLRGVS